jgi:16S rRNA (guanine(966)-N(2))-methyltransferase RsmD
MRVGRWTADTLIMRIIAGMYRSRTLQAPTGLATRPTSDRLRETLFNVLASRIEGANFLDLYAGSGAVGIEALSRGAAHVEFVERSDVAIRALRANLTRLGIAGQFKIHAASVAAVMRKLKAGTAFDVVFLDPPYDAVEEYASVLGLLGGAASLLLKRAALVIAEHRKKDDLAEQYGSLMRTRVLKQGDASLSFYRLELERGDE